MRFMMLMIPSVYQGGDVPSGFAPSLEAVAAMTKYNEELAKAGVLIALDGLHPRSSGSRIGFAGGSGSIVDGPYAESKEVLGGYWMINVDCREQALEWAKRVPADEGDIVEVRQVFEMEEFPEDVQQAGESDAVREAVGRSR